MLSRLHIAELNLRNVGSFGHFQLQTAVSWLKIIPVFLCIRSCSSMMYLVAMMLKPLTTGSLMAVLPSHGHFFTFFCGAMAWLGHCQISRKWIWACVCCWKVCPSLSFSCFIHIPRFSAKDVTVHPWKNNWPKIVKLPWQVGINRHSN